MELLNQRPPSAGESELRRDDWLVIRIESYGERRKKDLLSRR